MEAVLPTPMGMWRAVHEVQAASSENMRSATGAIREVKGATWYLLLLLVLYAACANAEDSNSPPAVRTGIIRSAHRAFGALMLTPQIRNYQQYCMIVVTVKGSTRTFIWTRVALALSSATLPCYVTYATWRSRASSAGSLVQRPFIRLATLQIRMTNRQVELRTEVIGCLL